MSMFRIALAFAALGLASAPAAAAVLTFDDVEPGAPYYFADSDGDSVPDVLFFTGSEYGFFATGPGEPQQYVDEPGLEVETYDGDEMFIAFLNGAQGSLSFGYAFAALGDDLGPPATVLGALHVSIFDIEENLIAETWSDAVLGTSNFPENWVSLSFAGTAAYATIGGDENQGFAYIIDNLTFEPAFSPAPEPASWAMMVGGFGLIGGALRRRRTPALIAV